mmetsp:Transcript_25480/g.100634  ORF Transcript_25480/g.100634 Transcript_25480/m.100634 type:complete len:622 (-) Transcript_25480:2339-4204(-)
MPLACERFATSKLKTFEDLQSITSFGFRGEALASISQVARLKIVSMVPDAVCAYGASYADGKIVGASDGQAVPKPCAGVPGTTVTAEDLFYNMPTRRNANRNASEEYRAIADIVTRYSIRYSNIAFSCKRLGDNSGSDIKSTMNATVLENIQLAFGKNLAQELLDFKFEIDGLGVSGSGLVSNANYNLTRRTFILFINGRLVDYAPLKKALDSTHSEFSPKGSHGFFYLDINMRTEDLDVNVHPTKREVRFLHGAELIESVTSAISDRLKTSRTSRVYYSQSLIEKPAPERRAEHSANQVADAGASVTVVGTSKRPLSGKSTVAKDPRKMVRTDAGIQDGAMEQFIDSGPRALGSGQKKSSRTALKRSGKAPPLLTSVRNLQMECEAQTHSGLQDVFREHSFVGVADGDHVLIQHRTKLMLVLLNPLTRELMYQKTLLQFADLSPAKLTSPVQIREVVRLRLQKPDLEMKQPACDREEMAIAIGGVLLSHSEMLLEYFGIQIVDTGGSGPSVAALPLLLEHHSPAPASVADLILGLGTVVNWEEEQECFKDIAELIADCYTSVGPWDPTNPDQLERYEYIVKHAILPATRSGFFPPTYFAENKVVRELASLERLYRTFERC